LQIITQFPTENGGVFGVSPNHVGNIVLEGIDNRLVGVESIMRAT
jgi:hypothetical protein